MDTADKRIDRREGCCDYTDDERIDRREVQYDKERK